MSESSLRQHLACCHREHALCLEYLAVKLVQHMLDVAPRSAPLGMGRACESELTHVDQRLNGSYSRS